MKVLLIEDEEHKAKDITGRMLAKGISKDSLIHLSGVRQAVLEVSSNEYDLVIVDIALPTFSIEKRDGSAGGADQAVGGIEILRALKNLGIKTRIIIVTQYPDVIIDGNRVRLQQAVRMLATKYSQDVLGAVLYSYKTPGWEVSFDALLGKVR
jgi:CheY-like chemotaxis protein